MKIDYKLIIFWILIGVFALVVNEHSNKEDKEALQATQAFEPVLQHYLKLAEDASKQESVGQKRHRGKTVMMDINNRNLVSDHFKERYLLPFDHRLWPFSHLGMRAKSPEDARTLVVVHEKENYMFSYTGGIKTSSGNSTSGIKVYRIDSEVMIIDLDTKEVLSKTIFPGVSKNEFPNKATEFSYKGITKLEGVGEDRRSVNLGILYDGSKKPYGIYGAPHRWVYLDIEEFILDKWDK